MDGNMGEMTPLSTALGAIMTLAALGAIIELNDSLKQRKGKSR